MSLLTGLCLGMYILTPFSKFLTFSIKINWHVFKVQNPFSLSKRSYLPNLSKSTLNLSFFFHLHLSHTLFVQTVSVLSVSKISLSPFLTITISLSLSFFLFVFSKSIFISPPLTFFHLTLFHFILTSFSALAKPKHLVNQYFFLFVLKETQIVLFIYFFL